MSKERSGGKFKVIGPNGIPQRKYDDDDNLIRSKKDKVIPFDLFKTTTFPGSNKSGSITGLPFDFLTHTTTFPENKIDKSKIIPFNPMAHTTTFSEKNNKSGSITGIPMFDPMAHTMTFPENKIDKNDNVVFTQQQNSPSIGNILTALGGGLLGGKSGDLFGNLFKREKYDYFDYNGTYTGTKETKDDIRSNLKKANRTKNLGLGLMGIGLLTNLFKSGSKKSNAQNTTEQAQGLNINQNQGIANASTKIEDKVNTIKGLKQDELGNYEAYKGISNNIITEEDDKQVVTSKIEAQKQWLKDNNLWVEPPQDIITKANTIQEDQQQVVNKKLEGNLKEQQEQAKARLQKQHEAEQKQEAIYKEEQVREQNEKIIEQQRQEVIRREQGSNIQSQYNQPVQATSKQTTQDTSGENTKLNEFGIQILSVLQTIADNTSKLVEFLAGGSSTPAQQQAAQSTVNNSFTSMRNMFGSSSQGEYNSGANRLVQMIQTLGTK